MINALTFMTMYTLPFVPLLQSPPLLGFPCRGGRGISHLLPLLHVKALTLLIGRVAVIMNWHVHTATCHERLLRGGLRHDLGLLVSHLWLLS